MGSYNKICTFVYMACVTVTVMIYTYLFRFSKTYTNDKTRGKAKRLHAEQISYYNCFEVILQFFNDLMCFVSPNQSLVDVNR